MHFQKSKIKKNEKKRNHYFQVKSRGQNGQESVSVSPPAAKK